MNFDIKWDGATRTDWQRLEKSVSRCPFEQSWVYGEAIAATGGLTFRAVVTRDGKTAAFAQMLAKRFGPVTIAQLLRGPAIPEGTHIGDGIADILKALSETVPISGRRLIFWTPGLEAATTPESELRTIGWRRVMTGYHTVWLDLSKSEEDLRAQLGGNWRNGLSKSEKSGLRIEKSEKQADFEELIENYRGLRGKKRFGGPSPNLLTAARQCPGQRGNFVSLSAHAGTERVAAILLVRHGDTATYVIGWASGQGRTDNATNLLLWRGMLELRKRGVHWLDLGGVDTHAAPGIARFKLGLGGTVSTLTGTYF